MDSQHLKSHKTLGQRISNYETRIKKHRACDKGKVFCDSLSKQGGVFLTRNSACCLFVFLIKLTIVVKIILVSGLLKPNKIYRGFFPVPMETD